MKILRRDPSVGSQGILFREIRAVPSEGERAGDRVAVLFLEAQHPGAPFQKGDVLVRRIGILMLHSGGREGLRPHACLRPSSCRIDDVARENHRIDRTIMRNAHRTNVLPGGGMVPGPHPLKSNSFRQTSVARDVHWLPAASNNRPGRER